MKVIISHDVDHLYGKEHWFRGDLVYPKLWVRSTIKLIKRQITIKEWWLRCISAFKNERHRIREVIEFDKTYGVPSTFFFGMNQGLGMSYKPEEAKTMIQYVKDAGFGVGVHGICFDNEDGIKKEYETFNKLMGFPPDGIRMHYVRFNDNTFEYLDRAGYIFDTTEFDKPSNGTIKAPYKVGNMWEFPLTIMDGYIPQNFEDAKQATLERLKMSKDAGLEYVTILFHDPQFSEKELAMMNWYLWLIEYLSDNEDYSFISYKEAIKELEGKNG